MYWKIGCAHTKENQFLLQHRIFRQETQWTGKIVLTLFSLLKTDFRRKFSRCFSVKTSLFKRDFCFHLGEISRLFRGEKSPIVYGEK